MRLRREMKKKRVTKEPYEGYTLPESSEKGKPFVDFHAVLDDMKIINRLKDRKRIIKKIRKQKQ
jgi:hypothetical protein